MLLSLLWTTTKATPNAENEQELPGERIEIPFAA
jgi:hypothetical protein